jgi:ribosomal protein L37E
MIFRNPAGAPELACDECGCRWFDRMTGACYECGVAVTAEARAEFVRELEAFAARRAQAKGVADRKRP